MSIAAAPERGRVRHALAEFRAAKSASGLAQITGYAVEWGNRNSHGEAFMPGVFDADMATRTSAKPLVMKLEHDDAVGKWDSFVGDATGYLLDGHLVDTSDGRDADVLVREGVLTGMSVGYWPVREEYVRAGTPVPAVLPNGKRVSYVWDVDTCVIHEALLREVSLVSCPSDDEARVTKVRTADEVGALAGRLLPALDGDDSWEAAAYSMALLMGARDRAVFSDLPMADRHAIYERVAAAYQRHGKTAPPFVTDPAWESVEFQHDERDVYADIRLRNRIASVIDSLKAPQWEPSGETLKRAGSAVRELRALVERHAPPPAPSLADQVRTILNS